MFERFSGRGRAVMVVAAEEARTLGHSHIGTEHLLLGLARETEGVAAKVLLAFGVSPEALRAKTLDMTSPPSVAPAVDRPPFTPGAKKALELSLREAIQFRHQYIGTEHLLLGVLREADGIGARSLTALGVELAAARTMVAELLPGSASVRGMPKSQPTSAASAAMTKAKDRAGDGPMTSGHLLGALVDDHQSQATWALAQLGVTPDALRDALAVAPLEGTSDAPPRPKTLELKLGESTTVIDDPELAAALSRMSHQELLDALAKVAKPMRKRSRRRRPGDEMAE
jgi:ATP-dependent Clp protease ATP-binding subunit ClpA